MKKLHLCEKIIDFFFEEHLVPLLSFQESVRQSAEVACRTLSKVRRTYFNIFHAMKSRSFVMYLMFPYRSPFGYVT